MTLRLRPRASAWRLSAILALLFVVATMLAPTAAQAAPAAATADPARVVVNSATGTQQYQFPVIVPAGGTLQPADASENRAAVKGEVVVLDAKGVVLGAYDSPVALDASGKLLTTTYAINGATLVQTVVYDAATKFPVVLDPAYNKAGRVAATLPPPGGFGTAAYVGVPSNYIYNPNMAPKALHDYCTNSPDEFPNPVGANANFRGPCARHDLCYGGGVTSKFTCDNRLRADMRSNCEYSYAWYNPVRSTCYNTANVYWSAVVIAW